MIFSLSYSGDLPPLLSLHTCLNSSTTSSAAIISFVTPSNLSRCIQLRESTPLSQSLFIMQSVESVGNTVYADTWEVGRDRGSYKLLSGCLYSSHLTEKVLFLARTDTHTHQPEDSNLGLKRQSRV